ncbi:MAG TPA: choice-of-anchor B family protein [Phycisphaerales bacterium]|nr:choice-of-anchor B family protein [Phycisphaerales bacterium]
MFGFDRRTRRMPTVALLAGGTLAAPALGQVSEPDWRKLNDPLVRVVGDVVHGPISARGGDAGGFPAENVTLLSWVPLNNFPNDQRSGNDCWGYVSPSGREYAIFGMQSGFSVLDVTDPTYPRQIGFIPGASSLWRDVKVVGHYAYGVSEGGLGIQVIDLSRADEGIVTHVQNKMQQGHSTTHNIAANTDSGYLYLCGANVGNGGLVAVATSDPADPQIVGAWSDRYVHDAQIISYTSGPMAGREIAYVCTTANGVDVLDVTDKSNMFRIGGHRYAGARYCHQAWASSDLRYLFVNDEMDEGSSFSVTTTHVLDISDPARPTEVGTFTSGATSTDHNLYVVGNLAFEANYTSGLRVFDVSDPLGATQVAYLDTSPNRDEIGYHGAWSTYPFFPSGNILISDIESGLFVLRLGESSLGILHPDGLPERVRPGVPTRLRVAVEENGVELDPGTVTLTLVTGDGTESFPMADDGAGGFTADLPAGDCFEEFEYWFTARDTMGHTYAEPFNAPIAGGHVTMVATGLEQRFADDFSADQGWSVDNSGAGAGGWARVEPLAGNAVEPDSDADGSGLAYVTGAVPGESLVGGPITLTSPRFDLSLAPHALLHYAVWYGVDGGLAAPLAVQLSNDDGASWVSVSDVARGSSWRGFDVRVADFVAPSQTVRLRFSANNSFGVSTVEAGVDDVRIVSPLCEACIADYNADGGVNTLDFLAYLNDFTGATHNGDPDLNGDGDVNTVDFLLFLNLFAAGCD